MTWKFPYINLLPAGTWLWNDDQEHEMSFYINWDGTPDTKYYITKDQKVYFTITDNESVIPAECYAILHIDDTKLPLLADWLTYFAKTYVAQLRYIGWTPAWIKFDYTVY
jgi:hypothetical protein